MLMELGTTESQIHRLSIAILYRYVFAFEMSNFSVFVPYQLKILTTVSTRHHHIMYNSYVRMIKENATEQ